MELGDFFLAFVFLGIALILGIIYLFKVGKAKKLLAEATEAKNRGDDRTAITLYKEALKHANEKPDMEQGIVAHLQNIYTNHKLAYDFSDYNKLIEQTRILKKKSSTKSTRELVKVIKLKAEMVDKMPGLS